MHKISARPGLLAVHAAALFTVLPSLAFAQEAGQWPAAPAAQNPGASAPAASSTVGSAGQSGTPAATPATPAAAPTGPAASDATAAPVQASVDPGTPGVDGPSHPDAAAHMGHPPRERPPQAGKGFVLAASIAVRPTASVPNTVTSSSAAGVPGLAGQLAIGYKAGRTQLTIGLDVSSVYQQRTIETNNVVSLMAIPGLQVALIRSRDQRAELIGSLRFGAGATIATGASNTSAQQKPDILLFYEIAPGARYWMHTQFAMQFTAGYAGQWILSSAGTTSTTTGNHGLSASLGAVGIF